MAANPQYRYNGGGLFRKPWFLPKATPMPRPPRRRWRSSTGMCQTRITADAIPFIKLLSNRETPKTGEVAEDSEAFQGYHDHRADAEG